MEPREDRVEPFVQSVVSTLRESAGVESFAVETVPTSGPGSFGTVAAVVRLTASGVGYLALSFSSTTATELTRRVLNGAAAVDDAMIQDCVGEMVNVVAGQAKALLYGTPDHFTFSTPTSVSELPRGVVIDWWTVSFTSEVGPFQLHLSLPA